MDRLLSSVGLNWQDAIFLGNRMRTVRLAHHKVFYNQACSVSKVSVSTFSMLNAEARGL